MSIVLTQDDFEKLKIDKTKLEQRTKKVEDKLLKSIIEITIPAIENHIMGYGLRFDVGMELAGLVSTMVQYNIAVLMEQGKLMKTIPGTKDKNEYKPGGYV